MKSLKVALINENWNAGATRCARDLEWYLSSKHTTRYYPRHDRETVETVLADLSEFTPDLVHCHSYYGTFPYHLLATVSHRYPTCFTPHDTRPGDGGTMHPMCYECSQAATCLKCPLIAKHHHIFPLRNPYFRQRLRKRYVHWRAHPALHIITPSQWLRQRLRITELRRFEMSHIPYGIDLNLFRPQPSARSRLRIASEQKVLLSVAYTFGWHLNPHKGLPVLADAFVNSILPKYPDAMWIIAGGGLVPNHPNVKPVGLIPQKQMPLYYSATDVFVAPSIADNLPFTVLEAMACGIPVVGTSVGGIPEEVEDGVTGYLVPPANEQALGEAIISLLANPEKRQEMSAAGRARAECLFSIERCGQKYEEVYYEVLNTWDKRRPGKRKH